ncbi:YihY/virulence factor BrkB family protein [Flagellimonas pacifica]|uniref:Membrane protein n=1 Tax=Flagellimonas pacifica TaxID=1247520 RepID=A0A285MV63_9FLAO|nr:YihY/virulence factor BrkB family protein [Allomuricauda parva]SNZ01082.1 membrane protein [Allomuricauda parva]
MFKFFKQVFNHFFNSNTFQKGAALAYYAVFSIFPIIIVLISVLGMVFGKQAVAGEIFGQLKDILGGDAALQIQDMIKNQHVQHNSLWTTIIGFVTLALSASGMLNQIHNAFNDIWEIKAKPKSSIIRYFTKHLASFAVLISLFFILLISTLANSFLVKYGANLYPDYKFSLLFEHLTSFFIISLIFAILFRFLGDTKVHWKPALISGLFTGLLFVFGKIGIGMYLGKAHLTTTFGSASVLALIMLWVYYTSQIIFLGASFVKILSDKMNYEILPNKNAVKVQSKEI